MTKLELPVAPPLPNEVRQRALYVVLAGMDAPPRHRARPLAAVAAAVVVLVLGGVSTITLLRPAPTAPELGPAMTPTSTAGVPAPPPLGPPTLPSSEPEPSDPLGDQKQFPDTTGSNGTANSLARCEAAALGSDRAADYPPAGSWTETDEVSLYGVDELLMINNSFLCLASPATVSVSPVRGLPVAGGVEIVQVGKDWLGVLNRSRAMVSWRIGDLATKPSRAPVLGLYLHGVTPFEVELIVADDGGTARGPIPDDVAPAVVRTDRPLPLRDSATPDAAVLDDCVPSGGVMAEDVDGHLAPRAAADSEPRLWQPLARVELPGGGFAVGTVIGDSVAADDLPIYVGVCIVGTDGSRFWAGERQTRAEADVRMVGGAIATTGAKVFAVVPGTVRVEVSDGDGSRECELRAQLALCADPGPGPLTYTLFDAAGNSRRHHR